MKDILSQQWQPRRDVIFIVETLKETLNRMHAAMTTFYYLNWIGNGDESEEGTEGRTPQTERMGEK